MKTDKEKREMSVVKSNLLIQKARYNVSAKENKIIAYVASKILPEDEIGKLYTVSVQEFCELCGIEWDSGKSYKEVKRVLQHLSDKSIWVPSEDGKKEILTRWFDEVMIEKGNGTIEVSFHKSMKQFFYELKQCFIEYPLDHVLTLSGKYSHYIYEFCKSWQKQGYVSISIEDFVKYSCPCPYTAFKDIRRWVIEPSVEQINRLTDITITCEPRKRAKSRKYTDLYFTIKTNSPLTNLYHAANREKVFEGEENPVWL